MIPKREIRPDAIVDTAIEVLARDGFAKFAVLRVAKAFGIRPSHLSYYFPTRDALVAAMSERLAARYQQRVEEWCREAMARPGHPMGHLIDLLIQDAVTPPTAVLFPALWEAANTDPNMASALDTIYRSSQQRLIELLGMDPQSPDAAPLRDVVRVLGVIVEGTTAIYGRRAPSDPEVRQLQEATKALLLPAFDAALMKARRG